MAKATPKPTNIGCLDSDIEEVDRWKYPSDICRIRLGLDMSVIKRSRKSKVIRG
jgi:hypothetical protein